MRRLLALSASLAFAAACGDHRAPPPPADDGGGGSPGGGGSSQGNPSVVSTPDDPAIPRYAVGDTLPGDLTFEGYLDGATEKTTIHLEDLRDPDGTKGIDAVLVVVNNTSCPYCNAEVKALKIYQEQRWQKRRITTLQLLHQNAKGKLASPEDALAWRTSTLTHGLTAADPKLVFSRVGSNAMPIRVVIDPRTLTVVYRQEGVGTAAFMKAEELAKEQP